MISKHKHLQEETRFRLLRILHDKPETSQRDLARAVGMSVGGLNYALKTLIEKGFIEIGDFTSAIDKRRLAYILTQKGLEERAGLTKQFLVRKMEESEALRAEIEALSTEIDGALSRSETTAPGE